MRLAVLGGGGFRTPLVYGAVASVAEEIGVEEVVLHDLETRRLQRTGTVIEGLRRERGGGPEVRATTDLDEAVDGAGVVFCAIRVGGLEGRVADEEVPLELGVLGQETTGPAGICFALRTVPVMIEVARTVSERAPEAWFLNFTNPAGLVTEAVADVLADRVVGICDSPSALCARVAAALGQPVEGLSFDYGGLNHLGWLGAARTRGEDLLPGLLADEPRLRSLEEAQLFGPERLRALGMIPNEYLVYYERTEEIVAAFRRERSRGRFLLEQQSGFFDGVDHSPEEALASWRRARAEREGTYMAEARDANDRGASEPAGAPASEEDAGYGSVAVALLRAVLGGADGRELVLDVRNAGTLPFLDDPAVVEVPCRVGPGRIEPRPPGPLPPEQRELVERVKEVERTAIRAAVARSAALAVEAMALHPLVGSRAVAEELFRGYRRRHPFLRAFT